MTHLEQAIHDAIEKGGYNEFAFDSDTHVRFLTAKGAVEIPVESILMRPAFWRALGKARVWRLQERADNGELCQLDEWPKQWHRFLDHISSGGTIESFFTNLT